MKKNLSSEFWKKIQSLLSSERIETATPKFDSALALTEINIRTLRAFEDISASNWRSFKVGDILRQYETVAGFRIPKNQIVIVTKVYEAPKTRIEKHTGIARTVHGWIIYLTIDGMIEIEIDFRFFRKSSEPAKIFENGKAYSEFKSPRES
ncbi:hypothetical protein LEP1GSC058_1354 [Leptospira fainei serovar Hurstbridge str. BUT 6]|uniref:Uncharacterized protein n=1 Tax=Leptospira fainei serovar Hurstbridge str. BUT 6 TaxID=1193011 RepID=S3V4M4_9LEPT|nr:hypothetical protein [Leptospira fainei]EPG76393.1 hypothetical protein LEP1GSC058_1354 [Leptospira fainei serovar Hurstbridge str. BUT 6]